MPPEHARDAAGAPIQIGDWIRLLPLDVAVMRQQGYQDHTLRVLADWAERPAKVYDITSPDYVHVELVVYDDGSLIGMDCIGLNPRWMHKLAPEDVPEQPAPQPPTPDHASLDPTLTVSFCTSHNTQSQGATAIALTRVDAFFALDGCKIAVPGGEAIKLYGGIDPAIRRYWLTVVMKGKPVAEVQCAAPVNLMYRTPAGVQCNFSLALCRDSAL